MAQSFLAAIALSRRNELEFESLKAPEKMGNVVKWGYGGTTIATGLHAAYKTVPSEYLVYSVTGNYLGPASPQHKLKVFVRHVRDTKVFATRLVTVSQQLTADVRRDIIIMTIDFQTPEPQTLLEYSAPPRIVYEPPEQSHTTKDLCKRLLEQRKISLKEANLALASFPLVDKYFEQLHCPSGVFAQNLSGVAKNLPTTQDHLSLPFKTTAAWFKCKQPLGPQLEQVCAALWLMDSALAYTPLSLNKQFFDDAEAVGSLDFAFRMLVNNIDINKWSLREMTTISGGAGRTYSEARLWDSEGRMSAIISQQCILRPNFSRMKSQI